MPFSRSPFYLCLAHTLTHQPQQWVFLPRSSGMGPGGASLPPLTVPCDCAKRRLRQHHNTLPTAPLKKGQRKQKGKKEEKRKWGKGRRVSLTKGPEKDFLLERWDYEKNTFLLQNFNKNGPNLEHIVFWQTEGKAKAFSNMRKPQHCSSYISTNLIGITPHNPSTQQLSHHLRTYS